MDKKYLPRGTNSWRGLLDPVTNADREGPRFGENARPGTGFNLLAQGLAQGYSPPIGSYFSPSSFRSEGAPSWLAQYAPKGVQKNGPNNWEEAIFARLNRAGMKTPGYTPEVKTLPAEPGAGVTLTPWQQWARSLSPEQRAMIGGDQGNADFKASLTPEQIDLQAAARASRGKPNDSKAPGMQMEIQDLLKLIMGGGLNLGNLGLGGG